ncbi:ABC transporter permease [Streptomyces sp. H27-D2]|nr:ABC transporter permease [Streptomyces sp. H27-D2]MEC4020060.1 ABC transporter permease [Streptomyces sp. H27-D2]
MTVTESPPAREPAPAEDLAPQPAPAPGRSRGRGRGRRHRWPAVVPFFAYLAVFFGVPAAAILNGAFTAEDPVSGASHYTLDNVTYSLKGAYGTGLVGSVELSAVCALLATVFGVLIAQAVVTSKHSALRKMIVSASGVLANFSGVPLAFAFIATLGNLGIVTRMLELQRTGFSLYTFTGLALAYLYFMVPLMVVMILPALDGLRSQWREAVAASGGTNWHFWRYVGLPVLTPSLLGGAVLLFGTSFASHATAAAMVGSSVPLITLQISNALAGNVLVGQENMALALSLNMVVVALLVMAVQIPLQRRSARWLG